MASGLTLPTVPSPILVAVLQLLERRPLRILSQQTQRQRAPQAHISSQQILMQPTSQATRRQLLRLLLRPLPLPLLPSPACLLLVRAHHLTMVFSPSVPLHPYSMSQTTPVVSASAPPRL